TNPALVTAGLGASRYAPGAPSRTASPASGSPVSASPGAPERAEDGSVSPDGSSVARLATPSVKAGDQRSASFRSLPTATNSVSQPDGTSSRGSPGAALMPTRGTVSVRLRHHCNAGRLWPA